MLALAGAMRTPKTRPERANDQAHERATVAKTQITRPMGRAIRAAVRRDR